MAPQNIVGTTPKQIIDTCDSTKEEMASPPKLDELLKDLSEFEESKQPREISQSLFLVRKQPH